MKNFKTLLILTAMLGATVSAQTDKRASGGAVAPVDARQKAATPDAADMVEGEVRKVDKNAQKITLKHGEIKNLGMPGMTMIFRVKDATLLDKVKKGDKIRFKAENSKGAIVVTAIEPVR